MKEYEYVSTVKEKLKYTNFLIFTLIVTYLFSVFFLTPSSFSLLVTNPSDLFSLKIYTLITSIFLHANLFHLFSNLLVLFLFGRVVEREIGSKIIFIFIAAGFISNVISHIISLSMGQSFNSLGASGAIAGLVVLGMFLSPFAFTTLFIVPVPLFLFGWMAILSDILGFFSQDGINHFAHIGGYLGVMLFSYLLERKHIRKVKKGLLIQIIFLLIVGIFIYMNIENQWVLNFWNILN